MSFATATSRPASPDLVNRRLVGGLLLSLVFHALLLALQFGARGLGLPSPFKPPPVSITLMRPVPSAPSSPVLVAPSLENLAPLLPAPKPAANGMRLVDPAPPPKPAKSAKPRRISRPAPAPTRVIARDGQPGDSFVVPLPLPEEAVRKTDELERVQAGSDDGADLQAAQKQAQQEQQARQAQALSAEADARRNEAQARLLERQQAEAESRRQAELAARADALNALDQQRRAGQEAAQRQQAEEQGRRETTLQQQEAGERAARLQLEQQQLEQQQLEQQQLAQARQRADAHARAQLAQQQADRAAEKQLIDALALKQKAEQSALKQQTDDLARQQAEQAASQQAAEAAAAAGQRERERSAAAAAAAAAAASATAVSPGAGSGGSGSGATMPKNLLGSDVGNRVREFTRGIDLLRGEPPRGARDDERGARRAVVGSGERDVPLRMYVDSFRQKVERNGGQGFTSQVGDRMRSDPLVSVALRSDGSVDDVTIVRSSGDADTDNAVRRIIRLNARYSAFPPNIADRYDVIEVRRVWRFAETLRLLEELR